VSQVRAGNVDCAITGSMSGNTIGLHEVTSHTSAMAVTWGLSMFGANLSAWEALPPDIRARLQTALPRLEAAIWADAERQHQQGLLCNTGAACCVDGKPGRMQLVNLDAQDRAQLQQSVRTSVLPVWLQRCGDGCAAVWNQLLAPTTGVQLPKAPQGTGQ
jgi:TRAP-type C4-dicarboxylate transport system substrate-binding protein